MLPYEILPGFDMYVLMICVAAVSAILSFRFISDKMDISVNLQNLCLFNGVFAIVGGYYSAVFFQALYNIPKNNGFYLNASTGSTFYGGLIGGVAIFLLVYFIAGHFLFKKSGEHKKKFWLVSDAAVPAILLAHGFGRLGCLFAGCCHGMVTDAWFGIYMKALGKRVVPTQLFEAVFLFALFAFCLFRVKKGKSYNLPIYMFAYGIWRFLIEYVRDDYRGSTIVEFLTPSQFVAIFMVIGAIALFFIQKKLMSYSSIVSEKQDYVSADGADIAKSESSVVENEYVNDTEDVDIEDDDD